MRTRDLPCVKKHGWKHWVAHKLGIQQLSVCSSNLGVWIIDGFKKGLEKNETKI